MSHREEAPWGRPRTRWRDYVSRLAWERLGVPPEELEEVSGLMRSERSSPHLLVVSPDAVLGEALHRVEEAEEAQQGVAVTGRQQVEEVLQVLKLVCSPQHCRRRRKERRKKRRRRRPREEEEEKRRGKPREEEEQEREEEEEEEEEKEEVQRGGGRRGGGKGDGRGGGKEGGERRGDEGAGRGRGRKVF
ncbi:hypothetical protein L3Q82_016671 [Scortum barcoo]|uniref:Uncharacterized protein n=1 Tax=Scortum barcoo TaxID=214431 RepID=A0ACB8X9D0_9TELE|nr:hypothetical protein L3Q82_016671 [Scortum barcoo]